MSHNLNIITEAQVIAKQQAWAKNIIEIGEAYMNQKDYKSIAIKHLDELYAYEFGHVLFKPTLASEKQFRTTYAEALSYFIGGHTKEDTGFALKPWQKIRFDKPNILINKDHAIAMGNYFFTALGSSSELKVEYTFVYTIDGQGELQIITHHSSLPYNPDSL